MKLLTTFFLTFFLFIDLSWSSHDGRNGRDGRSGYHGVHGQDLTIHLSDIQNFTYCNLSGSHGSHGSDGSDGSDAYCSNDTNDTAYLTGGHKGGDGGHGGNGGHGGDGGNLFIYYNFENMDKQFKNIHLLSRGGKGGQGGHGGKSGRGCESGPDGIAGKDALNGKDGEDGKLFLIPTENLPHSSITIPQETLSFKLSLKQLLQEGAWIQWNTWLPQFGAKDKIHPSSTLQDKYFIYSHQEKRNVKIYWDLERRKENFLKTILTFNYQKNHSPFFHYLIKNDKQSDANNVLLAFSKCTDDGNTEIICHINKAFFKEELNTLEDQGLNIQSGKILWTVNDPAKLTKTVDTTVKLTLTVPFLYFFSWTVFDDKEIHLPDHSVTSSEIVYDDQSFTLNLSKIIPSKYLQIGQTLYLDMEITRSFQDKKFSPHSTPAIKTRSFKQKITI